MTIRTAPQRAYMPGSNARAIEKARSLQADAIIILEDSVAPDAKAAAATGDGCSDGGRLRSARGRGPTSRPSTRLGTSTTWTAPARAAPDAILVPKISTPQQLEFIGQRLDMHCDDRTEHSAMIETTIALFNILSHWRPKRRIWRRVWPRS